jgi:hypothetical protein
MTGTQVDYDPELETYTVERTLDYGGAFEKYGLKVV